MPRDSGGTYSPPTGNPVAEDTLIDAAWANDTVADLGNEMTNTLHKDGRVAMTGPLTLSTRPSPADDDAATWEQIRLRLEENFPNLGDQLAFRISDKSANYTATITDYLSVLNFTVTGKTCTLLPAATAGAGYLVIVASATNVTTTVDGDGSETINGAATVNIGSRGRMLLLCNGSAWVGFLIQDYQATNLDIPYFTKPTLASPRETISAASASGAQALDLANQTYFAYTLTGNVTFSFSNVPSAGVAVCVTVELKQDATGSRTVTWPAGTTWEGGVAPTLTTTANKTDIFMLMTRDGGTTWFAFTAGQNF